MEKRILNHFEVVKDGSASSECKEGDSEPGRCDVASQNISGSQVNLETLWLLLDMFQYTSVTMARSKR